IRPAGVFEIPPIKWKSGLHLFDGSVDVGIRLGTNNEGNSTGSQNIQFLSRDGGATERTSELITDQFGNLIVQNSTGSVGIFRADGAYKLQSVTFANLPVPADGSVIHCSDCTIANPCAGAGTGALAKRLNGVWVCN
ncbi:hypothetical protein LCGC14_2717100, partial [marine sediment metagenome]